MLMPLLLGTLALAHPGPWPGIHETFEAPTTTWVNVAPVPDGLTGKAAAFNLDNKPGYADLGEVPLTGDRPFTLTVSLRTTDGSFSTPVMARNGEAVGLSVIMGREPGKVSFEAWSWRNVKLISKTRIDDGKWHTIKVEFEPTSTCAILWVDDKLQAAGALGAGSSPNAQLRIGNNIGADQPYRGQVDELTITPTLEHADRFAGLLPFTPKEQKAAELKAWREKLLPAHAPHAPATAQEWAKQRADIRKGVLDALNLTNLDRAPLASNIAYEVTGGGLRVQRIAIDTLPGCTATAWLWTATDYDASVKHPAMLMPHGHWALGAIDPVVQVRAARFARAGYCVLIPDSAHDEDVAAGLSACGVMLLNNMRMLDYLVSRPDVDTARIGVTGASGGAQQTMYLMATEDRLAAAAPVCMICDYNEILGEGWSHCGCNHAPGIAAVADQPTMCAVFAPKPVLYISATGDWTHAFPTDNLPGLQAIYGLENAPKAIESKQFNAQHGYDPAMRARVYQFFDPLLKPPHTDANESGFTAFNVAELRPPGKDINPKSERLAEHFRATQERLTSVEKLAPGLDWNIKPVPLKPVGAPAGMGHWQRYALTGPDGLTIGMLGRGLGEGTGPITLVVTDNRASLLLTPPSWLNETTCPRVALMEPRFTGDWAPNTSAWRRNGLLLGAGEGYCQARDIAQVMACLPGDGRNVYLVALGSTGVPAMLAHDFVPRCRITLVEDAGRKFSEDGNRTPLCPGILRLGDLHHLVIWAGDGVRACTMGGGGREVLSEALIKERLQMRP